MAYSSTPTASPTPPCRTARLSARRGYATCSPENTAPARLLKRSFDASFGPRSNTPPPTCATTPPWSTSAGKVDLPSSDYVRGLHHVVQLASGGRQLAVTW